jgi:hypothetical protein
MYELGIRVKEVREEKFKPYLYFYLAGDFFRKGFRDGQQHKIKERNANIDGEKPDSELDWCMIFKGIEFEELFN